MPQDTMLKENQFYFSGLYNDVRHGISMILSYYDADKALEKNSRISQIRLFSKHDHIINIVKIF